MLIPVGDRVIVREVETTTTKGGVVLPASSKELKFKMGLVLAVGDDDMPVKEGDTVYFNRHAGLSVTYHGEDLLVIPLGELSAVDPVRE